MAKIKVFGDAAVIVSDILFKDLKELERFNPDALVLYTTEGKEVVPVFLANTGAEALFDEHGIIYTGADENGFATTTIPFKATGLSKAEKEEYVKEEFMKALFRLNALEKACKEAFEKFSETANEILSAVEFVD